MLHRAILLIRSATVIAIYRLTNLTSRLSTAFRADLQKPARRGRKVPRFRPLSNRSAPIHAHHGQSRSPCVMETELGRVFQKRSGRDHLGMAVLPQRPAVSNCPDLSNLAAHGDQPRPVRVERNNGDVAHRVQRRHFGTGNFGHSNRAAAGDSELAARRWWSGSCRPIRISLPEYPRCVPIGRFPSRSYPRPEPCLHWQYKGGCTDY